MTGSTVVMVDLRLGDYGYRPSGVERVLVVDRVDDLLRHHARYQALAAADAALVVIAVHEPSLPPVVRMPTALSDGGGVVLVVGARDIDPAVAAAQGPETFDRIREVGSERPWRVARVLPTRPADRGDPPGAGPVSGIDLAQAAAVADDGSVDDPADDPVRPDGELGRVRAEVGAALERAERLSAAVAEVARLIGAHRPTAQVGPACATADASLDAYRRALAHLLERLDNRLRFGTPSTAELVRLGVAAPPPAPREQLVGAVHQQLIGRLAVGWPPGDLARQLRTAAAAALSADCTAAADRFATGTPMPLPLPPFPRWPLPFGVLAVVLATCLLAGLVPGAGPLGWALGAAAASGWWGAAWLVLARRPQSDGEAGFLATLGRAAGTFGIVGVAGAILGASLAAAPLVDPRLGGALVACLLLVVVPAVTAVSWRRAAGRWRTSWSTADFVADFDGMTALTSSVLRREWRTVDRRDVTAAAAAEFAACLDEVAMVSPDEPSGRADPQGALRALVDVAAATSMAGRRAEPGFYGRRFVRAVDESGVFGLGRLRALEGTVIEPVAFVEGR